MKVKESHSKMKNINYKELKIQAYFQNNSLSVENKRDLFSFRTRMANFGENFRGQRDFVICPFLCNQRDSQEHSFLCMGIKEKIEIDNNYEDIFKVNISTKSVYVLTRIRKFRDAYLEEQKISVFPTNINIENKKRKQQFPEDNNNCPKRAHVQTNS